MNPSRGPRQWSHHSDMILYSSWLLFKFCLCVCPPHMTSAPLPGKWKGLLTEGPWNIITSFFIGTLKLTNGKLFRKLCCYLWPCCAAPLLLLQPTSPGTVFRGEGHFVRAPGSPFLSPWTHQALQVGISLNSGNFQSCNLILAFAAYSATSLLETKALFIQFENMSSLSFNLYSHSLWITAYFFSSCYLLIHLMKEPFAFISSTRVNWACIWTVLSLDPHFLTSNILFSLLISAFSHFLYNCRVTVTTVQERAFFLESHDSPR